MALYNSGSVNIVIGSANVRGNSTAFTTYVSSGDLFKDNENNSFYEVGSIVNATNLTLTSRYADASYQTARAENVASANTATTIYSDTLSNTPLIQNYIVITASERFTDNGSGVLAGNASPAGSGTVDYDSGLFSITLGTDLTGSVNLSASYYSGDTRSSMPYKIITDFTPNYDLPELNLNDREFNTIFTKAMRLIDARLYVTASHTLVASDFTQDGGMLVGTGTGGVYQEETGATLLTSLGAENVTLHSSATAGGMSLSSQEIHNQAASDSQNGYVTATYISIIDNKLTNIVEDISPQLGSNLDMNSFNIQTVTPTEMTYVHGVTSAIQTQLSNKLTNIVEDVSPQLGSNLDMNGFNIQTVTPTEMAYVHGVTSAIQTQLSNKLTNLVEDVSPQLGSNLDVNGKTIVSVSANDIIITPDTTGEIILDNIKWPQADGTSDQLIKTDGAGQLSWVTVSSGGLGNLVEDTSPQLGSNLDMNGFNIQTVTPTEMAYVHGVTSAIQTQLSNKLTNIVEDVSPQLGSNLDMNGFNIGGNSEAQLDDAVSTKHTQNTDTALSAQSENLDMNSHKVVSVTDPTSNQDAATKKYVDDSAVSKTVTSKSSDYSVVATDLTSFTAFTNKTATASINFSLDEATTGRMTSFMVRTASYLKCTAGGSDKFEYNGELGVAGGDIRSNTIGSYWAIGCYEASIWTITDLIGTIKYDE